MKKIIFAALSILLGGSALIANAAFLGVIDNSDVIETALASEEEVLSTSTSTSTEEEAENEEEKIEEEEKQKEESEEEQENSLEGLEKILSPDMLKQYRNVIKKGMTLYGVRIASTTAVTAEIHNREQASSSLEKILTPNMISLFTNIKKVGNSLWGIRKATGTAAIAIETASSALEKIPSPDQIGLFEKVRQVGNALWGIKKNVVSNASYPIITSADAACVSAAIDKKDDALVTVYAKANTDITTAIKKRANCQKAAIAASDTSGQRETLKACANEFSASAKTTSKETKEARNAIWKTYKDGLKACNTNTGLMVEDGGDDINL